MEVTLQYELPQIPPSQGALTNQGNNTIVSGGNLQSGNYSPNGSSGFVLQPNGDAVFNNLTARGRLTVTEGGVVGGFDIGADYLRDTGNSFGLSSAVSGSNDVRFWAGDTLVNRDTAPLRFYEDGTGVIGAWNITTTKLRSGASDAASNILLDPTNSLLRLGPTTGNYLTLDGANQRIRSSNYSTGVSGFTIEPTLIEAENIIARGTLRGATFTYDAVSAVGGQLMVTNADTLASDMTALDASTLTVKGDTTFAVNDILLMRGVATSGIQEEWLRVTAIGSAPTYTVTRDVKGDFTANNNPVWKAGTPVVKQGVSDGASTYSGGWLRLIGEGTNAPYYSVFARTGVAYNAYTETIRLGNLNGFLDYASNLYGIGIGETTKYLKYDPTNGLRIAGDILNTTYITAGEDLTANDWVGIASDGKVYKADGGNADAAEKVVGVVLATTSANGSVPVQMSDKTTAVSGLTIGSNYYLQNPTDLINVDSHASSPYPYVTFGGTEWLAQTVTTVGAISVSGIKLRLCGYTNFNSELVVTVSIRATSAGLPTGADLVSGTIIGSWVTSSYLDTPTNVYVQFATPYALSASTQYAIVVRCADQTLSFAWFNNNSDVYAGGQQLTSSNSGTSFSLSGSGYDLGFALVKSAGTIGTTAATSVKKVGVAISATKLLIIQSTASGTYTGSGGSGTGDMVLSSVQTITGAKTFGTIGGDVGKFILAGSTSGSTILNAAAVAGSGTVVLPTTGTLATLAGSETFTNKTLTSPVINTPTGIVKGDISLGNVDNTSDSTKNSATATLTNKRINPRLVTATSYTTDTGTSLDVSTCDQFEVTAQAGALLFNSPSGTPLGGQKLTIRIKDNGTARALTWNAIFRPVGAALPSTTVLSKTLYLGFIYNATDSKWDLVASAQEV